ncbi:MAG: radical SAM protein [Deltaproteobacteria bacterium]|jgi:putative pyruvate formate lyase activating enzyme|nr:radical SAM protein [Deltaproteobacteria bacterium]
MAANTAFSAAYLSLLASGELEKRVAQAVNGLAACQLCPRSCLVNRLADSPDGFCRTGRKAILASFGPHYGEERALVGKHGSGTIFFGHCNLACLFCQNWQISQRGEGHRISAQRLADIMLGLQSMGCHNINLVSPSHVVAQVLEGLLHAAQRGLKLPLIYNSGGYDSVQTLRLLDGIIDLYMPDMKFADSLSAAHYLGVDDYAEINQDAVREMFRQVGHPRKSRSGIVSRGLIIRHLVLPDNLAGTDRLLHFIAREFGTETWLNLMDQYRPDYCAPDYPPLDRRLKTYEFRQAYDWAVKLGLSPLR